MGEKIPYKARKPGGGRKKLKPEYNAGKNLKEQMDAAVIRYKDGMTLQAIADALSLNPIKVRKLLITAGIYESDVAEMVRRTFSNYRETQSYKDAVLSTASALKLSRASVTSYLPYEKGVYFPKKSICGKWLCFILEGGSKPTPVYPLPMKYEKAGMGNIQKSFGSTAGRTVKAWPGVRYCWHCTTLKR